MTERFTSLTILANDSWGERMTTISQMIRFVPPVWCIIGIPGNILAGLVWIQRQMRPSSGIFLAVLALDECFFLILQMINQLYETWHLSLLNYPYLCEAFAMTFMTTQHLSPLLVLGFTIQRYVAICHPFMKERFCTTRKSFITIGALLFIVILFNAAQLYFWTFDHNTQECTMRVGPTEGGWLSPWSIYSWIVEMLVFGLVPISIFILNVLVVRETRRITRAEEALTLKYHHTGPQNSHGAKHTTKLTSGGGLSNIGSGGKPSATTLTLLAVSSYLIITVLPVTVLYLLSPAFNPEDQYMTHEEQLTDTSWQRHYTFSDMRAIVEEIGKSHSALNFYIYLLTRRIFRKQLKLLLLKFFCRGRCVSVESMGPFN